MRWMEPELDPALEFRSDQETLLALHERVVVVNGLIRENTSAQERAPARMDAFEPVPEEFSNLAEKMEKLIREHAQLSRAIKAICDRTGGETHARDAGLTTRSMQ
jgi:hypothetical protein